jgi:hypothetical protein
LRASQSKSCLIPDDNWPADCEPEAVAPGTTAASVRNIDFVVLEVLAKSRYS